MKHNMINFNHILEKKTNNHKMWTVIALYQVLEFRKLLTTKLILKTNLSLAI